MGKTLKDLEDEQKERIRMGKSRAKSAAMDAMSSTVHVGLLATLDFCVNTPRFVYNNTLGRAFGRVMYQRSERPLNLGGMLELLMKVHADEIFVDGLFNGDPHPGNILLMDDGRLGLIDYGQVKELDVDTRIALAQLFVALQTNDREAILQLSAQPALALRTRYMNPELRYRYVCFYHDRDTPDVTMGLNVQQFSEYLDKHDPIETINDDVVMVARTSILLRGMANAFQLKLRTSDYWGPVAKEWLRSVGAPVHCSISA